MLKDFIAFSRANIDHSFAQNFQDLFALWVAGGRKNGYFVEFGALNGRDFSNTYMLEKLGWTGIVSEPHPDYEDRVLQNRNCHISNLCVFDTSGDTINFRMVKGRPAMSGIGETQLNDRAAEHRNRFVEVPVKTITLNDLLGQYQAPTDIDYISIDTEGSELRILKAFDFEKYNVKSFCIEHNFTQREAHTELMEGKGYQRVFHEISDHDDWWVRTDLIDNIAALELLISNDFQEVFERNLENRRNLLQSFAQKYQ